MQDIAKMKADFAKQIEMAELENSINSKLLASLPNGYEIFLLEATGKKAEDRGIKYDLHTSIPVYSPHTKYNPAELLKVCAYLLKEYPVTQKVDDREYGGPHDYIIGSHRGFNSPCGELSVRWLSGEFECYITLPIEGAGLLGFFKEGQTRPATDIELDVYTSVRDADPQGRPLRYSIKEYNFKASQVVFYGGHRTLTDDAEIQRIIDNIKSID
jgi:hypothetical protein